MSNTFTSVKSKRWKSSFQFSFFRVITHEKWNMENPFYLFKKKKTQICVCFDKQEYWYQVKLWQFCDTRKVKYTQSLTKRKIHFFPPGLVLLFFEGAHRMAFGSTVSLGFLNCADFICSSTIFGVTHITCCPFQYFTMFIDCSVDMISVCEMDVFKLEKQKCFTKMYKRKTIFLFKFYTLNFLSLNFPYCNLGVRLVIPMTSKNDNWVFRDQITVFQGSPLYPLV